MKIKNNYKVVKIRKSAVAQWQSAQLEIKEVLG